ncbi:hypothetical protein ABH916_003614 [Peribacillus frigoritolerans]
MNESSNVVVGLLWATFLSFPLWLSFFGWIKIIMNFIK